MKRLPLLILTFTISAAYGQNEFAATAFYNDFKMIHADGQAGFINNKGAKKNNTLAGLVDEYKIKHLLPLADSGKIVVPILGNPYAEFYFQPGKTIEEANKRVVNLREAIRTAYAKPLFTRTETSTLKDYTFSNTWFFTDANETKSIFAVFKSSVFKDRNKYFITFQVIGRAPPQLRKSELTGEIDLDGKMKSFFNDLKNCFGALKNKLIREGSGFTSYESKITLFGIKGEIEETNVVCRLKYSISYYQMTGLDEANSIYDQLKSSLLRANNGMLTFSAERQSDYNKDSYSISWVDHNLQYKSSTKNGVTLTIVRNAEMPAVYLDFDRKKN